MIQHLPQVPENPATLLATTVGAILLSAGLLWLSQSSALATTGQRIYELDRERRSLLERRSEAMLSYAAATDPRQLEERAIALGFVAGPAPRVLVVNPSPDAVVATFRNAVSPLALTAGANVAIQPPGLTLTERMLARSLSAASADAREAPHGIGSAP